MKKDPTQTFLETLPEIVPGETFWFACHPEVPCFNACCSDLTMPLTPYDVLRLCEGLKISSEQFFEEFAHVGCYEDTGFPLLHLRMEDGPDRLCPFVTEAGCGVYAHRSAACRTYPLGRAVRPKEESAPDRDACAAVCSSASCGCGAKGEQATKPADAQEIALQEQYFLVREAHCKGFAENRAWTTDTWLADQGLEPYNRMNNLYMQLVSKYKSVANGAILSGKHATMALLCLYQQDRFLEFLRSMDIFSKITLTGCYADAPQKHQEAILENPEQRLEFAYNWIALVLLGVSDNLEPKNP